MSLNKSIDYFKNSTGEKKIQLEFVLEYVDFID